MKKLFFILVCLCIKAHIYALSTWDGVSASTTWYTQGSGAAYHIKTAADLAGLSKCFSQGYYMYGDFEGRTIYLDDDIDLAGYEWTPIGTIDAQNYYYSFAGSFDGQGHTVKGLKITKTNQNQYIKVAGLFGYERKSSFSIKNLKVEGDITLDNPDASNSYTSFYIGGLVGYTETECSFENCQSNININVTQNIGEWMNIYCGGIVGSANCINRTSIFGGCYSKGSIYINLNNANKADVGGIAGQVHSASAAISQCASEMNIEVANGKQTNVGGITGFLEGIGFGNVYFNGSILLSYPSYGLAGGICGMTFGSTNFEYCLVTGSILRNYGTSWLSAISGTSGEGISVSNCYYLSTRVRDKNSIRKS